MKIVLKVRRRRRESTGVESEPKFVKIAGSLGEAVGVVRRLGLEVRSGAQTPPGFEEHWRVYGGGGKILAFSRRRESPAIYISRDYLRAWEELCARREPGLFDGVLGR